VAFCSECGTEVPEGKMACPKCGARLTRLKPTGNEIIAEPSSDKVEQTQQPSRSPRDRRFYGIGTLHAELSTKAL
jgi:uncharacterized membrane protein YvbJ